MGTFAASTCRRWITKQVHDLIYDIANDRQRRDYEEFLETDFPSEVPGLPASALTHSTRIVAPAGFPDHSSKVLTMEDLGMGQVFRDISMMPRGLVLVTGPTGSGKSTTLAAMMDYINDNKYEHVLTIEDPIEFVHESKKCLINQREVHRDTHGFAEALRSALREDPDIILVGEMRDLKPSASPGIDCGRDGPPGFRHPAHDLSGENHRPGDRRVSRRGEINGALHAVGITAGGGFADTARALPVVGWRPTRSCVAPRRSAT